jgi:hypothetical protein
MGDADKQTEKTDSDKKEKRINDPLVRTDVEAPREPFERTDKA